MAQSFQISVINPETIEQEIDFIKMSDRFFQVFNDTYGKESDVHCFYKLMDVYAGLNPYQRHAVTPREKNGKLKFNFIDIRPKDKGLVSYMPGNREQVITSEGKWSLEGRQTIKVGRFIKAFFPQIFLDRAGVDDRSIEKFSGVVKGQMNCDDFEMRIVDGEDIRKYYHYDNYIGIEMPGGHASSSLSGSCMRGDDEQEYLDPYVQEPGIKLAVLFHKESNKVAARALLWDGINFMDNNSSEWVEITFMDRIYAYREWMIEYMLDWATEQGYYRKRNQSGGDKESFINPDGERVNGDLMYKLVTPGYNSFPYMDTMSYADQHITELRNDDDWSYWALHGTGGNFDATGGDDISRCTCQNCGSREDADDMRLTHEYSDDGVCPSCIDSYYVYSEYYNEWVNLDDVEEYNSDYRFSEDMSTCDYDGDRYPDSDMVSVIGEGGRTAYVYVDNYVLIREGKEYIIGHPDLKWHEDSGEYVLSENMVECAYNGDMVHIYDATDFGHLGWVSDDYKSDFIIDNNLSIDPITGTWVAIESPEPEQV